MTIRPIRPEDYAAVARIWNEVYPSDSYTAEEFARLDAMFEPPQRFARFVAEVEGEVVGSSNYAQFAGMYHPQKFMTNVFVDPEFERQGIGGALYTFLLEQLAPFDPISLRAKVRENLPHAIAFAEQRGFQEDKRDWEAVLDVSAFDPEAFAGLEAKLASQGIVLMTFLEYGITPDSEQAFHEFFSEVRLDIPRSEPATPLTFQNFRTMMFDAPDYFAEGVFFAIEDNDIIGMTMFWKSEGTPKLFTGLTAVRRPYRGQGIATALKVRALTYAQERGVPEVYTDNDTRNIEMITVNDKLGFRRLPAWLGMVNVLQEA